MADAKTEECDYEPSSEEEERVKEEVKKVKAKKLKPRIYVLKNADKSFHEKWEPERDLLNFPHPYRLALMARPNSGKSNFIKNIIIRASPPFRNIILLHPDGKSNEYDDVNADVRSELPAPEAWGELTGNRKTLCIVDDIEIKLLPKNQRSNLDRLFGYVSTHKNVSVIITSQCGYNIPVSVRRNLNLYCFWKSPDVQSVTGLMRKAGLTKQHIQKIFKEQLLTRFDNFLVDMTAGTPAFYRKNGYDVIPESYFDEDE